jgi:hypothetical protein
MDRHFQLVRSKAQNSSTSHDGVGTNGRIYLDASARGAGSIRDEPSTRRFLTWLTARKSDRAKAGRG